MMKQFNLEVALAFQSNSERRVFRFRERSKAIFGPPEKPVDERNGIQTRKPPIEVKSSSTGLCKVQGVSERITIPNLVVVSASDDFPPVARSIIPPVLTVSFQHSGL